MIHLLVQILSTVRDSILAIRGLNYHKGLHNFSIVVLCNLDSEIMSVLSAVRSGCDVGELAVCGIDYKVSNGSLTSVLIVLYLQFCLPWNFYGGPEVHT